MRSALLILDRTVGVITSLRRRLAEAQAREKNARAELADLQYSLQALGKGLGLDEALSAVSSAAGRTEAIAQALHDMKAKLKARETELSNVAKAMELPTATDADQVVTAAKECAKQAHALEILHPVLRSQTKSFTTFSNYIIANAEDEAKLRRYIGLPTNKTAG